MFLAEYQGQGQIEANIVVNKSHYDIVSWYKTNYLYKPSRWEREE